MPNTPHERSLRWRPLIILAAALVGCRGEAASRSRPAAADGPATVRPFKLSLSRPDIVLIVTGGTSGMTEVCNCPTRMAGGLASRSGLINSYRAAFDNVFVLDSGDLFWIDSDHFVNGFVLKGYAQIGYDAVVLGEREWSASPEKLRRFLAEGDNKLAYLSTTVRPARGFLSQPVQPVVTKRWGRVKLAVLADIRKDAFQFSSAAARRLIRADDGDLARRVERLKADGYVVVVVVHGDAADVDAVARSCRGRADLIVRGHTTRSAGKLRFVGSTPVVKVGGHGTVGVVAMRLGAGGRVAETEFRVETLDDRWPMDARLIQTYQAFVRYSKRAVQGGETAKPLRYVGSSACGRCHPARFRAWRRSAHARSYKTLVESSHAKDANCLACHTSGYGFEGGYSPTDDTPALAAVTCQSCHRFDPASCRSKSFAKTRPRVTVKVCTSCHTPSDGPKSTFRRALKSSRCVH